MIAFRKKSTNGNIDDVEPPDLSGEDKISAISKASKALQKKSEEIQKIQAKELFKPVSETQKEVEAVISLLEQVQEFMFQKNKNPKKTLLAILPFDTPLLSFVKLALLSLAQDQGLIIKPSSYAIETTKTIQSILMPISNHVKILIADGKELSHKIDKKKTPEVYIGGWPDTINKFKEEIEVKTIEEVHTSTIAIVTQNSDIDLVVGETIESAFAFNGQYCSSQKGALVDNKIYEEFIETLQKRVKVFMAPYPAEQPESTVTKQVDRTDEVALYTALSDAIAEGAEVIAGGGEPEKLFYPTVITNLKPERKLVSNDFRAPYLWVAPYKDHPDEFLENINKKKRGVVYGHHATLESRLKADLGWDIFNREDVDGVLPWQGTNPVNWLKTTLELP